ncbi:beta-lactamase-like protein [Gilbertella persicaria]|uniref:beta-lactamase-like protein n=1 Tax=Gilbertella persicaria TaxID=101096 RepID=UPI002220382A|nr:beta-lactamase-like protein [Gilbertella persicaria]KAI8051071.1 beta-lactamase-like protein [Gilbertella persicaria]
MASVVEIVFLGTGTSSSVPSISCLTSPKKSCSVCLSSQTPEGRKNNRRNTSMVVRFRKHSDPEGARLRNVLIDCGKTFYDSAIQILPQYGIRELDGVIITHGHADACYGMDDLRGWTLGGTIQSHIDVHLSPEAMEVVTRTFPFLVDASMATGGGEVADFKYYVFDPAQSFTIEGLEFTPLPAHHGKYITTNEPYFCYGFHFDGISYISDTNYIPKETMDLMVGKSRIFVVDCLRLIHPHASHFMLDESIEAARKVKAFKTYYVGFAHRVDHYLLEDQLKELEKTEGLRVAPAFDGLKVSLENTDELVESCYFEPNSVVVK